MRGPVQPVVPETVVSDAEPNGGGAPTPKRRRGPNRIKNLLPPEPVTRRSKIAIMGYTEHRNQAPFLMDEWEIWGLNDLYHELPDGLTLDRLRWFQIHEWTEQGLRPDSPTDFRAGPPHPRDPNHVPWLKEWSAKGMRLYLLEARPELPGASVLNKKAMYEYFGHFMTRPNTYFTNSISWMLGHAIMELVPIPGGRASEGSEIGVFGVDMMMAGGPGSEYGWQRPSCEMFIGIALGAGIKVYIPDQSDLLKCAFPYGEKQGGYFRKRAQSYRNEMSRRRGEADGAIEQAKAAHHELTGAINCIDWILKSHMPGDPGEPGPGRVPVPDSHKGLPTGVTTPEE
jgi:hypothetical protein